MSEAVLRDDVLRLVRDANTRLLENRHFSVHIGQLKRITHLAPVGSLTGQWNTAMRNLKFVGRALGLYPNETKAYMFDVASAHLGLGRRAATLHMQSYVSYCKTANARLKLDVDAPKILRGNLAHEAEGGESGVEIRLLKSMKKTLDIYKRQLSYSRGLSLCSEARIHGFPCWFTSR